MNFLFPDIAATQDAHRVPWWHVGGWELALCPLSLVGPAHSQRVFLAQGPLRHGACPLSYPRQQVAALTQAETACRHVPGGSS